MAFNILAIKYIGLVSAVKPDIPWPLDRSGSPFHTAHSAKVLPMKTNWARPLCILTAIVFLISAVFPVAAGLSHDTASFPHWWGILDVGLAFVLASLALAVLAFGQSRITIQVEQETYAAYRVLIHGIFVLLVIFVFLGDRIVWAQCLSGIAWRSWLLLYVLPAWIAGYHAQNHAAS